MSATPLVALIQRAIGLLQEAERMAENLKEKSVVKNLKRSRNSALNARRILAPRKEDPR